jgi:hypothetical protein
VLSFLAVVFLAFVCQGDVHVEISLTGYWGIVIRVDKRRFVDHFTPPMYTAHDNLAIMWQICLMKTNLKEIIDGSIFVTHIP